MTTEHIPAAATLKGGVWIERSDSTAERHIQLERVVSFGRPFKPLRTQAHPCYLPAFSEVSVSTVPVAAGYRGLIDGKRAEDAGLSCRHASWFEREAPLDPHHFKRMGWHVTGLYGGTFPWGPQRVGPAVERTTSEYLENMEFVRENALVATLKGHLEFFRRGDTSHHGAHVGLSSREALERYNRPVVSNCRWVPGKLVGAEGAFDDLDDEGEGNPVSTDHMEPGDREAFSYGALVAKHCRWAEAELGYELRFVPEEPSSREFEVLRALGGVLRMVRAEAARRRCLIRGGRERMEPTRTWVRTGYDTGEWVPDGKPEPTEVHRNEHPADAVLSRGAWQVLTAMRQELPGSPRRTAAQDENASEFHAGSGIRKAHSHIHLEVPLEVLKAEERDREIQAVADLVAMRGFTPEWDAWYRKDGHWVLLSRLDDVVLIDSREDPSPYIDERGANEGVWRSDADQAAYDLISWE